MDPSISKALTWVTLGLSVIMFGFTGLDVGSGNSSTALWIGLIAWLIMIVISGWTLWAGRDRLEVGQGSAQ